MYREHQTEWSLQACHLFESIPEVPLICNNVGQILGAYNFVKLL